MMGVGGKTRRYVAFLRGISPMNAKMAELRRCFEAAGFSNVVTVLASGNVVFDAPRTATASLERRAEVAMSEQLGRPFLSIVRPLDQLDDLLASDPFASFRLPKDSKRVVTFLRKRPKRGLALPIARDGARILAQKGRELFTAYIPSNRGAPFMVLIEKTYGREVTTRTWETVRRVARS